MAENLLAFTVITMLNVSQYFPKNYEEIGNVGNVKVLLEEIIAKMALKNYALESL